MNRAPMKYEYITNAKTRMKIKLNNQNIIFDTAIKK